MDREYWEDINGYMIYLSCDDKNDVLIQRLWNKRIMTYFKQGKQVSHHFKIGKKQLKKLPIDTFKRIV